MNADAQPQIDQWLLGDAPNWDAIDFPLPCSRCGYDLRMLTVPRCPECGLEFTWREVFRARVEGARWLFEYRWRDRPIRAYFHTLWRGLRPWSFWRDVSIHDEIKPLPLWLNLITAPVWTMLGMLAFAAAIYWPCLLVKRLWSPGWSTGVIFGSGVPPFQSMMMSLEWMQRIDISALPIQLAVLLLYQLATLLLLCSLRQTLGRCRVRTVQVLRVAAYALPPAGLLSGAVQPWLIVASAFIHESIGLFSLLSGPLFIGGYLAIGLGRYLKLPRSWLLGPVAVIVGMLFTGVAARAVVSLF
jgi:hypothetical protein